MLGLVVPTTVAMSCRDFSPHEEPLAGGGGEASGGTPSKEDPLAGASGDPSTLAGASAQGDPGGESSGAGAGAGAGAGGEAGAPHVSAADAVVAYDSFRFLGGWATSFAFTHEGVPHFLAYSGMTGEVTFERLSVDRTRSTSVWSYRWGPGFTLFGHFSAAGVNHFFPYNSDSGLEHFDTFAYLLQGPVIQRALSISTGFTHVTAPNVLAGFTQQPAVFWYNASTGFIQVQLMSESGDATVADLFGYLPVGAKGLVAVPQGDLLIFFPNYVSLTSLARIALAQNRPDDGGAGSDALEAAPVLEVQSADCQFAVDRIALVPASAKNFFFLYDRSGLARLVARAEDTSILRDVPEWSGEVLPDAENVTSTVVGSKVLVLLQSPSDQRAQVVEIDVRML